MEYELKEDGKDTYGNYRYKGKIDGKKFMMISLPNRPNSKTGKHSPYVSAYRIWHNGKSVIARTYTPDNDCRMSTISVGFMKTAYGDGEGGIDNEKGTYTLPEGLSEDFFIFQDEYKVICGLFLIVLQYPNEWRTK